MQAVLHTLEPCVASRSTDLETSDVTAFHKHTEGGREVWRPTPVAAGPFTGLQGGAVASLLCAEAEARAGELEWGSAVSASVDFLRPTPMADLVTTLSIVREGNRATIVDNHIGAAGDDRPTAVARLTFLKSRPIEMPAIGKQSPAWVDPETLPRRTPASIHGGPWFMDAMEVRDGGDTVWFRMHEPVVEGAGGLASVLGPADWTHGLGRPFDNVAADPNPNLSVHVSRPSEGEWLGVRADTTWNPASGTGHGRGQLLDRRGEFGAVSMSVALIAFPA